MPAEAGGGGSKKRPERAERNHDIRNLIGKVEVLPDDYGMKAESLAELLEKFRVRSGSAAYSSEISMN
jgi:hypothetical protein